MFRFGDMAKRDRGHSFALKAHLPIDIQVFDVGGGLAEGAGEAGALKPEEVVSEPLRAFMGGLMDPRIRWDRPRGVSARGFLSVLGESLAAPPPAAQGVGGASFVVLSDRYMNFSTKAGYHFSTVDTYCGKVQNKNYVHFRFAGGGAAEERRARRVRFLSAVLSHLGFQVQGRDDLLTARLDKYDCDVILAALTQVGRLTMCARQLDMLMDTDNAPEFFAGAFIRDELEVF
jgi:pyruvate,water dikinase